MFDPSRNNWENQSLLSLAGRWDAAAQHLSASGASLEPAFTAPRGGSNLRSLFDRLKQRFVRAKAEAVEAQHHAPTRGEGPSEELPEPVIPEQAEVPPAGAYAPGEPLYWRPLINPFSVFSGIARSKRLIFAATVLGAVAGVLVALATPREYYAAAEILFDPRNLQLAERDLTSGSLPSDATLALIENQVAIIMSSTVLGKVAERLNLTEDPEFNGEGGGFLGLLLNPRALLSVGASTGGIDARRAITIENLAEKLHVARGDRTFIIHIGAATRDPEKSALVANTTAEVYLEQASQLHQQTANRANAELTSQLDELRAAVEAAEKAVADYKAENDLVEAQGRFIADDEIIRLNEQLAVARARTAELTAHANSAKDLDLEGVLGGALPEQISSPVMTELLSRYAALQQEADRMAVRLGPRHPDNLAIQAELTGAREAIAAELRRVVASIQVELRRAVQLEQELAARLAELKAQKGSRASEHVRLRELEREAAARRAVYESFLLRARETGQQGSLNTANVNVISQAYPPLLPMGPGRSTIAIAGTLLGFLAGIALGAGRGAWESLRENMEADRTAPRQVRAAQSARRRPEDKILTANEGFDPPPDDGPGGGQRSQDRNRANVPHLADVSYMQDRFGPGFHPVSSWRRDADEPPRLRGDAQYYPAATSYPPTWQEAVTPNEIDDSCDAPEPLTIEDLRDELRALRREVDALAERRALRRA